ncbi:MAG: hypothetical protein HYV04_21365 [Deltaproteobacteria bacterium]|nr:hypothetical protein [Deltaproteobacteria bacterium]
MAQRSIGVFEPDVLLPPEFWAVYSGKTNLQPEKRLMLAVLEDAIACIQKQARSPQAPSFREAVNWFLEENNEWVFSFDNICAILGISSNHLRDGLMRREWKEIAALRHGARHA